MDTLIKTLVHQNFAPERILPCAPLSRYTTFRVGGPADVLVNISSAREIAVALRAAKDAGVPATIIGNGSNLLVRDGGIRGLVIRISGSFSAIEQEGTTLRVQAGAALPSVASYAREHALDGMAPLSGIPGTIGGAVIMNAGAYGGEMSQIVTRVDAIALSDGKPIRFEKEELGFGYRQSAMMQAGVIVTDVTLELAPGDCAAITARTQELLAARREKQPLDFPSAGSTFKRPEGYFAAKLIDDAGLRGLRIGDAQVSEKHAGFIINRGSATASDILALMEEVSRRVEEQFGVTLDPEVHILGEDA